MKEIIIYDELKDYIESNQKNGILDFIIKIKNPYISKINGKSVRIRFSYTDKTAEDCFRKFI